MVGNSRNSYDVPFRSCLGNSWCRAVNSIPKAKLYLNVSRITQFTRNQVETILAIQTHFHWATSLMGVIFPLRVDPLLPVRAAAGGQTKSCLDFAENRAANSQWVGDHRYTRIKFASKLL